MDINECSPDPCQNDGTCRVSYHACMSFGLQLLLIVNQCKLHVLCLKFRIFRLYIIFERVLNYFSTLSDPKYMLHVCINIFLTCNGRTFWTCLNVSVHLDTLVLAVRLMWMNVPPALVWMERVKWVRIIAYTFLTKYAYISLVWNICLHLEVNSH